jgi:hypothetical protein
MRVVAMTSLAGLLAVAACGSDDEKLSTSQTGGAGGNGAAGSGATGSGGMEGGLGGAAGASASGGFGGLQLSDAAPPSFDGPDLADAGWFDCSGCACNGATHYCLEVTGGAKGLPGAPPPPDAALCGDTGSFGCTPLPPDCVDAPSCSCIPVQFGGACQCSDDGGGLLVFCALP